MATKWSKPPKSLEEALDLLDIDKNKCTYASDRRGAIKYVRGYIKSLQKDSTIKGEQTIAHFTRDVFREDQRSKK